MILIIDNYDSFVFNLARYVQELNYAYRVVRNDAISLAEVLALQPTHIIISPGPKAPQDAGICIELIKYCSGKIPILGVCLGHQAIGAAFGAHIIRAPQPIHGKKSVIQHEGSALFQNIPMRFNVGRYHSLIVAPDNWPAELMITARTDDNIIMALQHRQHPVYGVQFHPESVLTEYGYQVLQNFLQV